MILLSAGEESGDLHGAEVARALRERWPDARLLGLGGPRMAERGVELLADLEELAVMGFVEVLSRLPFFWRLERRIHRLLDRDRIDLVLPVDYPGFNLRLARAARERGVPVLYYIAPQVWAWKEGRTRRLARDADRVAVILPFEEALLREGGASATFVGHPLLEREPGVPPRAAFLESLGLAADAPLLALFPGSREQELERHMELFLETARRIRERRPEVRPVLARAGSIPAGRYAGADVPITTDGRALLAHGRAALVKSGTTTLEAALETIPFVTVYRTHPLTWLLARRLVKVPHVALANLVAGEEVVPEVLQDEATPERLAERLLPLVDETDERARVVRGLSGVRRALGEPGAADRVASLAAELLDEAVREPGRTPGGGPE